MPFDQILQRSTFQQLALPHITTMKCLLSWIGYLLIGLVESHYLGRPSHVTSPHWIYVVGFTEEYHEPRGSWKLQELSERDLAKRGKDLNMTGHLLWRKLKEGNASGMCSTDYQQAGRHMTRYGIRLDVSGATQSVSIAFYWPVRTLGVSCLHSTTLCTEKSMTALEIFHDIFWPDSV